MICLNFLLLGTKDKNERVKRVMSMIVKLQDFVSAMKRLETDDNEYALLKAIVLFSPGKFEWVGVFEYFPV